VLGLLGVVRPKLGVVADAGAEPESDFKPKLRPEPFPNTGFAALL